MFRRALLSLVLLAACLAQAQLQDDPKPDPTSLYNKAMTAYNTYEYDKACRALNKFFDASNEFHELSPEVVDSVKGNGKSVAGQQQAAMQAENAREPGRACAEYYLKALLLAVDKKWPEEQRAVVPAQEQYVILMQALAPAKNKPKDPADEEDPNQGQASLQDIVKASKVATEKCATEDQLHRDPSTVPPCVSHLLSLAREQKSQGKLMLSKLNFQRAMEVNKYLGTKQNPIVNQEAMKSIREIEAAERRQQQ